MDKSLKVIFSLIVLLCVSQFVLIIILFNRDSVVSAPRNFPNQDPISYISSERAKEVALDYISHGTAGDVTLVNENGSKIYAVNIRHENIHYVIYVDGETGDVVWLTREEVEGEAPYEGTTALPEALSPDDDLELD